MELLILSPTVASACIPLQQREQLPTTRRYTKEEWEAQRGYIVGMYPLKGMTLKSVADFLYKERGFFATERQLKRKIAEWELDKNVKGAEMKVIVRKQQRRRANGKETEFRVRGQPIAQTKIDRWQKRTTRQNSTSIYLEDTPSPAPTTPTLSAISYTTPSARGSLSPLPMSPHININEESMHFPESHIPIVTAAPEASIAHRSIQPMIPQDDEFQDPVSALLISQFLSLQALMSNAAGGREDLPLSTPYDTTSEGDQSINWNYENHRLLSKSYQLAYSLFVQGRRLEADAMFQAAATAREELLGANHRETVRFKLEITNIRKFWCMDFDQNNPSKT